MALPIERWARQAVLLETRDDYLSSVAPASALRDIETLKQLDRQTWQRRQRDLVASGVPLANQASYTGLGANPPAGDLTTKTSISGEVGLMTAAEIALYMGVNGNAATAPSAWRMFISGDYTTAATPGNLTITPRIGTTTSGVTLGASAATALTASITAARFIIMGNFTLRSTGVPGANSSGFGFFQFLATTTAGNGPITINTTFGHTVAAFDSTAAWGLFFGLTHTVTTVTYTPRQAHWIALS